MVRLIAIVTIWLGAASVALGQQYSRIIQTSTGPVRGRLVSLTPDIEVYEFIGIPFAEPPIGQLRFEKPVPKRRWSTVLDATRPPKACMQPESPKVIELSEDCLYLNIWVPRRTLDKRTLSTAPYTYIHGGSFTMGSISDPILNSSVLAGYNNIVVATMQYRLGSLGFSYQPGPEGPPGNMGLWDQLEAMKWLHENFAAFGADGSQHTLGGNSAGAISVSFHLLSDYSRPYFKRAVMQAGAPLGAPYESTNDRQTTIDLVNQIDYGRCAAADDKWQCLKDLPASLFPAMDVRLVGKRVSATTPVADGDFLRRAPMEMLMDGDFAQYPLLIGLNKDEGRAFLELLPYFQRRVMSTPNIKAAIRTLNFTDYVMLMRSIFGTLDPPLTNDLLFEVVKYHYWPVHSKNCHSTGTCIFDAVSQALGDYLLTCPTLSWATTTAKTSGMGQQLWVYHYSHQSLQSLYPAWAGVTHAVEKPFLFGEPLAPYASEYKYSSTDAQFSRLIMSYWANFVKNGDPSIPSETSVIRQRPWPSFAGDSCDSRYVDLSSLTQLFNYGPDYLCGFKSRDCSFWDNVFFPLKEVLPAEKPDRFIGPAD